MIIACSCLVSVWYEDNIQTPPLFNISTYKIQDKSDTSKQSIALC